MALPALREPIRIGLRGYGTQRIQLSPKHDTPLQFYDPRDLEAPIEEVLVRGCSEVVIQGRMKGDYYAECAGPRFCVAAYDDDVVTAMRAAIAKAEGR